MKKTVVVFLAVLMLSVSASAKPKVEFKQGDKKIDVLVGGKLFTTYRYSDKLPEPTFVPLRTPSGIEVTRRNPLTELRGGTDDHVHHVGLFFRVDNVNGTRFWNYHKGKRDGQVPQIKHVKNQFTGGEGRGTLSVVSQWIGKRGDFVLEEKKTAVFIAGDNPDEYAIDFSIDLTAQKEKVTFEDIEEGMFAVRYADCLRENRRNKMIRPGQPIPKESIKGTGMYFSSNGDETADNVWGKRARWVAIQGVRQDKVVGIAILNHPQSINYPTYWHARDYGLFSANPLGQGDFQRQQDDKKNRVIPLNLTLNPGETVHFRFLVIAYEGVRTAEQIQQRFKTFVK